MKTDDDIRAALERIQPSMDLKRKTVHRTMAVSPAEYEKAKGPAGARWPLAVNGLLTLLVLAIIVWSMGEAGLIRLRPVPAATSPGPRTETFNLQSPDGTLLIECKANFYSLAMSSRQGLEFQVIVLREMSANEKIIVETIPSSGTILHKPEQEGVPAEWIAFVDYYTWTPFEWSAGKETLPDPGKDLIISVSSYLEDASARKLLLEKVALTISFADGMYFFKTESGK